MADVLARVDLYDANLLQERREVRRIPSTVRVGLVAGLVALIAGWLSIRSSLATAYPDAVSHATIARRLWDGADPGFGQLGTVWLPVPHLLLAPLTMMALLNEDLWRAGVPAVLLSSVCMGVAAAALYRILYRWGVTSPWVACVAVGVYVLNPSNLYVHTTALTEPVLMAAIAMSAAGLSGFLASQRPLTGGEVAVYAGLPAAAAVGSRYDGWVFVGLAAAMLLVVAQSRWGHWRYSLRVAAAFCMPSGVVALWWVVLNATQYGDVLAFQRGPYSAQALQRSFEELGLLPTKGSLAISLETYSWVIWYVLGPAVIVGMLVGLVLIAIREPLTSQTVLIWVLVFPLPYHVLALVSGQTVIWHPHTDPPGLFNVRYALPLLIPATLAIGYALKRLSWRRDAVHGALVGLAGLAIAVSYAQPMLAPAPPPVIAEATAQIPKQAALRDAVAFLRVNAVDGDTLLVDETVNPGLVSLGWGFDRVIGRFDGRFDEELEAPTATWVLANSSSTKDQVWQAAASNPVFPLGYSVVFEQDDMVVLRRV